MTPYTLFWDTYIENDMLYVAIYNEYIYIYMFLFIYTVTYNYS